MSPWTAPQGTAALIFDCDGTLADTMPVHYRAWTAMLAGPGLPFTLERFYQLGGVPTGKIIAILAAEQGKQVDDIPRLTAEKERLFLELLHEVRAIEPVKAVAEAYRGRLPMAVASGGYRDTVGATLDVLGVRDWFDTLVCAEDTQRHKPDPDVFLEAARRLGAEPARCVVFEDTDIGLEAARRAGMHGVDVRGWNAPV